MRSGHRVAMLAVICCLAVGTVAVTTAPREKTASPNADTLLLARATNEFAIDVYSQLASRYRAFAFSPASVATVFAMAYEGARGATAEDLRKVFRFESNGRQRRTSYTALLKVSSANAVWTQTNRDIRSAYTNSLFKIFSASRTPIDFDRNAWVAKRDIDRWIEVKTNGEIAARERSTHTRMTQLSGLAHERAGSHIPDFNSAQSLSVDIGVHPQLGTYMSRTHLLVRFKDTTSVGQANEALSLAGVDIVGGMANLGYLVVAVPDDGTFGPLDAAIHRLRSSPFVDNVTESPVLGPDVIDHAQLDELNGRFVLSNAMYVAGQFGGRANSAVVDGHRLMEFLSENTNVSLLLLTPRDGSFADVERKLTPEQLNDWIGKLTPASGRTAIPRLTIRTTYSLRSVLETMGVSSAFSDAADFGGINRGRKSPLQSVAHRASIDVTVEGIEAAAATLAGGSVVEPREPSVNLPVTGPAVLFLVRDRWSGTILLMGRMYMPPA